MGDDDMEDLQKWKDELEYERAEKDKFLGGSWQSPVPTLSRRKFQGLDYYPPDADMVFQLELHEHSEKEAIEIEDTTGNMRPFIRWGEFRFKIGEVDCVLQTYKGDPSEERLFMPFKDATSGKETYGAGRYLDLESEFHFNDGKWTLDFNRAYNPWCAYNHNYSCPFVPPENWLKAPVRAGEKNYEK